MGRMMSRTANPALSRGAFAKAGYVDVAAGEETMTVSGTVNRTAILLMLVLIPAALIWKKFFAFELPAQIAEAHSFAMPWLIGGLIGGLVFALITIFKSKWASVTAPAYAIAEGMFLGGISSIMELSYPGIVIQAIGLTFGTLFVLLFIYKAGIIKVTDKFRTGVVAATGAIFLVYMATMVLGFFGVGVPYIHGSGLIGIGFSLFVVGIAALNLVLDFDLIERGAAQGAPKHMEWYGAFALMVTLIWLYIEILRLLAKLRSR